MEANDRLKPPDPQQYLNRVRGLVDPPVVQSGLTRPHAIVERRPFANDARRHFDPRLDDFGAVRSGALGEVSEPVN